MKEFDRLGLMMNAPEVVEMRTSMGKTFNIGNGQFRLKTAGSVVHYQSEDGLEDIDLTPIDMGDHYRIDKAPFIATIAKDRPYITYQGKDSGLYIELELEHVDYQPYSVTHELDENVLKFIGIQDNDLHVVIKASGISTEQHVYGPNGCKTLGWKVRQNHPDPIVTETKRQAKDANGKQAEIQVTRTGLQEINGKWEHTFSERVTGKKLERDPATRRLIAVDGAAFKIKAKS